MQLFMMTNFSAIRAAKVALLICPYLSFYCHYFSSSFILLSSRNIKSAFFSLKLVMVFLRSLLFHWLNTSLFFVYILETFLKLPSPKIVSATPIDCGRSIEVRWEKLPYRMEIHLSSTGDKTERNVSAPAFGTTHIFDRLMSNMDYEIWLRAINYNYDGSWTKKHLKTMAGMLVKDLTQTWSLTKSDFQFFTKCFF